MLQLVEPHSIDRRDPRFVPIDAAAFQAKNLYNAALYLVRQAYIFEGPYLGYEAVYHQMKGHEAYRALPTKVAQQVLRLVDKNWQSYFAAVLAHQEDPPTFRTPPRMPRSKHKTDGRYALIYTTQAISRPGLKAGLIQPSMLAVTIQTKQTRIAQVRIVSRTGYYVVEVADERAQAAPSGNPALYAAVDIGVDNLAAITSNKVGFVPRLVNGRPVKSTNQFYNKRRAELQEALGHPGTTARRSRAHRSTHLGASTRLARWEANLTSSQGSALPTEYRREHAPAGSSERSNRYGSGDRCCPRLPPRARSRAY